MSGAGDTGKLPTLRWLHLTDLHVGSKNESQQTALVNLIEAIRKETAGLEFDFVILSGDMAYSGQAAEYAKLEKLVISPLRDLENFQQAAFIATPGNHDLDCDVGLPVVWANIGQGRQNTFFDLGERGIKTRSSRAQAFAAYADFIRSNAILGVNPTSEPARLDNLVVRGTQIAVVSAVTAFFSDKDVKDFQISPAPVHPLRTLLQGLDEHVPTIVLAHHPLSWFSVESEKHLRTLLIEKSALYINGHEHEITSSFGGRGLISIGFGAVYQNTLDAPIKSHYRNSFAICELNHSLHVKVLSWDSEHGKWRVDKNLPPDFVDKSECLGDGFRLALPTTPLASTSRPYASLASTIKAHVELDKCVWLASSGANRWMSLLTKTSRFREVIETYSLRSQKLAAGHHEFRVKDPRGNHLVYVVSGSGDILGYDHLQSINTELDTQDYIGCIVATLGSLSDEATTLANKLKTRKSITILEREKIIRDLIRYGSGEIKRFINEQDAAVVKLSVIVTDDGIAILRQERVSTAWFDVIGENGEALLESDAIVVRLRNELPEFKAIRYRVFAEPQQEFSPEAYIVPTFDLARYLEANYAYFDDVKYAPLAALGLRFKTTSLSEIYVSATADVNGNSRNSQSVNRALDEFIESLHLPKAQRDQLESQLRTRLGVDPASEVGAARQLYQRYNNVVVLGDPGSGKTCFVKNEILAYCKPPAEGGSWYCGHLPIYVSLAEASRLSNESTSLLDICEILSARRGIPLPKGEILRALSAGRAAMFFDGLDEVGFIEKRIQLMGEISELIEGQAKRGNRFVLASRPAAVQPVEIPEGLTYLHLKGLSEQEMRILAARVLTTRVGELDAGVLTDEEAALVEKLLEDTKHSPGIARIARNPLLLTLLVLIYANTGAAISAKRHIIYTQAIKTLVSVRGRETKEQQISEADLRTRLGAVAVSIFSKEIAEIPRRSEVVKVLSPFFDSTSGNDPTNGFLQEVAEATGLLSIHAEEASKELDLITFMHYSFLEYYAAAGLLSRNYIERLPEVAGNPRWKDVITLLFGILSEHSDVTPAIEALLSETSPTQDISKSRLLLAMECAAECDVPPLGTQKLLANAISETVSRGVGRTSGAIRSSIAEKLGVFLLSAGAKFEAILSEGLQSKDALTAAAFADLIAKLPLDVQLSDSIVESFNVLFVRQEAVTTAACMFAVERRDELRIDNSRPAVVRALKGSLVEKHAALKVLAAVPAYYEQCAQQVEDLLDDANDFIASTAAKCVLANNKKIGELNEGSALVEKLLTRLSLIEDEAGLSLPGVTLDRQQISLMIASSSQTAAELALRYISLVRDDPQFIHQTLLHTLKTSENSRHKAASLDSLRLTPRAIDLITIADTDLICSMLSADERNVRIAAIRLLGEMPDDEQVIRSLQENLQNLKGKKSRDAEITETARALSKHTRRSHTLRSEITKVVSSHLSNMNGFGNDADQQHLIGLLTICETLDTDAEKGLAAQLLSLAEDYRTPDSIRKHALRAYGNVSDPTIPTIDNLIRLLGRNDPKLSSALYTACLSFVSQCKRKVEYVRRVYPRLQEFRNRLQVSWMREVAQNTESIDLSDAREIRDAVIGIEDLVAQYGEFSERARLNVVVSN